MDFSLELMGVETEEVNYWAKRLCLSAGCRRAEQEKKKSQTIILHLSLSTPPPQYVTPSHAVSLTLFTV